MTDKTPTAAEISAENIFKTAHFPKRGDGAPAGTADTNGWDTVYTVHASVINAAIAKHFGSATSNDAFRMTADIDSDLYGLHIEAVFSPWQIVSGGSGNRLRLRMPIAEGKAEIDGRTKHVFDLAGTAVLADVTLGFHRPPELKPDEPVSAHLKILVDNGAPTKASAEHIRNAGPSELKAEDKINVLDLSGILDDTIQKSSLDMYVNTIKGGVQEWLQTNSEIFDYIFLSVDIAEEADKGDFAWIKPTTVGYAVADVLDGNEDVKDTVFGIMAMTEGRQSDGAALQIAASAIPADEGINGAFLIAPHLVISKLMQPRLKTLFDGADAGCFVASDDGLKLQNSRDLFLPLELEPEFLSRTDKKVKGKIAPGKFFIEMEDHSVRVAFRNVSIAYGTDNELDLQLTYDASNAVGLDADNRFAMRAISPVTAQIQAQPNQEKMAHGIWKTLIGGIIAQALTAVALKGLGTVFSKAAGKLTNLTKVGAEVTETEMTSLKTEAEKFASTELESLANPSETASIEISPTTSEMVWNVVKMAATKSGIGVANFLSGICTSQITMMVVGQGFGSLWAERSQLDMLSALHEHPEKMRTMVDFAADCIAPITWPHTESATLEVAGLNKAFTLGLKISA